MSELTQPFADLAEAYENEQARRMLAEAEVERLREVLRRIVAVVSLDAEGERRLGVFAQHQARAALEEK